MMAMRRIPLRVGATLRYPRLRSAICEQARMALTGTRVRPYKQWRASRSANIFEMKNEESVRADGHRVAPQAPPPCTRQGKRSPCAKPVSHHSPNRPSAMMTLHRL